MFVQVLDDTTFAIFVIMALTTTVVATPLMTYLLLPLVTRALRPWLLRSR